MVGIGFSVTLAVASRFELGRLGVIGADGAVVDGLEALLFEVALQTGFFLGVELTDGGGGDEIGLPVLDAVNYFTDAALGEIVFACELGLRFAGGAVGEEDGLVAGGWWAFFAGEGAVVGGGCG